MDPSLSVTSDPHHPPPFTSFPPFTNSNPYGAANHPFYGGAPPNNNQFFQVPPNPAPVAPPHPSFVHPPYSDMICTAIAALNEPDGSSKQAISRYIERIYTGIPPAHGALLTHHLRTLKASGILTMVKKSYKFAVTPPPTSVAVAAAAASAGLEPPRSDFTSNPVNENQPLPDQAVTATPLTQKRGRGRPPKPKPEVLVQHSDVSQINGKPTWEQNELPISRPEEVIQAQAQPQTQPQPPIKRPPGRPRKDGALPTVKASSSGGMEIAKRRGRPPSGRAAGRERKPAVVSAPVSVYPYVANGGVRRRGRPRRVDAGASSVAAAAPPPPNAVIGGEQVVVAKRGRGRPPKIGGVIRKPLKRGYFRTGRPVGRPRKNVASKEASGQQAVGYGELKKNFELFQEKAKRVVEVLKAEMVGKENQAVVQAIQDLEELTVTTMETTDEPQQHMEAMQADEHHPETEPEGLGQAQMQPGEHHPETEQAQTEAEAMQEALF
uniref:HMG-Y-related protein A n=1 Tax=Noccaea caerulescens TaxID=107243 RepID=A0A1J3FQW4_NOCCA